MALEVLSIQAGAPSPPQNSLKMVAMAEKSLLPQDIVKTLDVTSLLHSVEPLYWQQSLSHMTLHFQSYTHSSLIYFR